MNLRRDSQEAKDVLRLCLRLCLEPAESHSPETLDVLDRYRAAWEAAAGGMDFDQALALVPSDTATQEQGTTPATASGGQPAPAVPCVGEPKLPFVVEYRRKPEEGFSHWTAMAAFDFDGPAQAYAKQCYSETGPWEYQVRDLSQSERGERS